MSTYWKDYWDKHLATVSDDDPFRQVLRVQNGEPMEEPLFQEMVSQILDHLNLSETHSVLDLCCGNGLISAEIAPYCRQIIGVDFSEKLIQNIALHKIDNIIGMTGDALKVNFQPESFHRILFAAALQHFTQSQVIRLLTNQSKWLKPGGILLITDILDSNLMWEFYNNEEREGIYFKNILEETPILGTWFDRLWLIKLARHAGFSNAKALNQDKNYPYSHYRFDLLCTK